MSSLESQPGVTPSFGSRKDLSEVRNAVEQIRREFGKILVGQDRMTDLLIAALLANGHVLIEGVPGVAKTLTARLLARDHVLVVVFYENTELTTFVRKPSATLDDVYTKTMAEKFIADKQEIVAELRRHGITSVLAPPHHVTPRTINTYLDLKARGKI